MKIKEMLYKILPPCRKCPYTLGLIYTVSNPCPKCELNSYQSYEWFRKQLAGEHPDVKNESE